MLFSHHKGFRARGMRTQAALIWAALGAVTPLAAQGQALRAFGEAEGFGAVASGARATPSIYHVTNLNNSGTGSFRDALSVANRIVVFDVGGTIALTSTVASQSNITIAGQTAPGGGILITGQEVSLGSKSNIIVRHMRFRPGDASPSGDNGINLYNSNNIILDHVSIEYAKWNNIDAVTDNGNASQVTIQHSIVANPIGQQFAAHTESLNGAFTWSNNVIANSHNRMPLAKVDTIFKNNVVYNYGGGYTVANTSGKFTHDIVNNYFVAGPGTTTDSNAFYQINSNQSYYSVGNVRDTDDALTVGGTTISPSGGTTLSTPWSSLTATLPTLPNASAAYTFSTTHAGASIVRDEVDNLVIGQVRTLGSAGAGYTVGTSGPGSGMYNSANSSGITNTGLGSIAFASRPAGFDADNDGIADTWELAHGLSPSTAPDALLFDPLGYRMIERYANELAQVNDTRASTSTGGPWTNTATWASATVPAALDYAKILGSGITPATVSISAGTATAMNLTLGAGTSAAGDKVTLSGGKLDIYNELIIGETNNAAIDVSGGTLEASYIILGNTVYSPATSTYNGTLNLSSGTLAVAILAQGAGTPGTWSNGGQLNFSGGTLKPLTTGALFKAPTVLLASGGTIDTSGLTATFSGTISGALGLTKIGAGRLDVTGTNTNTGITKISAGVLGVAALTNAGVPGPLGAPANADAANLVLDGGTLLFVGPGNSGTDRLLTLTANGGTLDAGSTGGMSFNAAGNAIASGSGNRTLILTGTVTGANFSLGLVDPTSGKLSLNKQGTGRWIIHAAGTPRTYSGDTTISAGTLLAFDQDVLPFGTGRGNLVVTAGTFELNGNSTNINGLSGTGTINNRSATKTFTLGNGNASATFGGTLANVPLSSTSYLSITKIGTGTQTFTGTLSYIGLTTVSAGQLNFAVPMRTTVGSLLVNGTGAQALLSAPPSSTANTIVGEFFGITGTADGSILVASTDRSVNKQKLLIASNISIAGTLDITNNDLLIHSMTESAVRLYVATWWNNGTRNGPGLGSSLSTPSANPLTTLGVIPNITSNNTVLYSTFDGAPAITSDILVKYTYIGDTNLDGKVDTTDLANLMLGLRGAGTGWGYGDTNYDGLINAVDYTNLLTALRYQGAPLGDSGTQTSGAVPEPANLGIVVAALPLFSRRTRRIESVF